MYVCASDSPIKPTLDPQLPVAVQSFFPRQSGFETRTGPCIRVELVALFSYASKPRARLRQL